VRQIGEQGRSNGQEPAIDRVRVVFEPAPEAGDETFLVGTVAGSMIGDGGKMGMLPASQAAD
jgi:hypothetical protein